MKTKSTKLSVNQVKVDGLMTFGMLETGQRTLPKDQIRELPVRLVRQASTIAQKVLRELICKKEVTV